MSDDPNTVELTEFIIRIIDTRDFLAPAENIRVRAIDPESAANMTVDIYEEITGEDIGEPIQLRNEKFIYTFLTEQRYFLEVINCRQVRL